MNKKNPRTIKFKSVAISFVLLSAVFVVVLNYAFSQAYIQDVTEPWLTFPTQEASYVIGQYNSTHYYAKNWTGYGTSANKGYEWLSDNATEVFQNCLDDGSISIFVMSGTYTFTAFPLKIYNDTILAGAGMDLTKFIVPDGIEYYRGFIENEDRLASTPNKVNVNITLRDFEIQGFGADDTPYHNAINFLGVQHILIERLKIHDFPQHAVRITGNSATTGLTKYLILRDCYAYNCSFNFCVFGANQEGDVQHGLIEGNRVTDTDVAISVYNAWDVTISNNLIWDNNNDIFFTNAGGISVEGLSGGHGCKRISIMGNKITGSRGGISVLEAPHESITIIGNTIANCWGAQAIKLNEELTGVTCIGNSIFGNNTQDTGILAYSPCIVIGNTIVDAQFQGIELRGNITKTGEMGSIVTGNFIQQDGGAPLQIVSGNNHLIEGNIFTRKTSGGVLLDLNGGNGTLIRNNLFVNGSKGLDIEAVYDTILEYNKFEGVTTPIDDGGINTVIRYNQGFITENSGLSVDKANGDTIAHGLEGTPDFVQLTCLNSTYDGVAVLVYWDHVNSDATNISLDIYWSNGTAISDGVIAVSWNAEYKP